MAASPFNGVKLDLALVLVIALPLVLALERSALAAGMQLLVLAAYGLAGMGWLVVRTRRVLRKQVSGGDH